MIDSVGVKVIPQHESQEDTVKQGYWETRAAQLVQQSSDHSPLLNQWIERLGKSHDSLIQLFIHSIGGDNPSRHNNSREQ
jgi:hypothetical protein